MNQPKSHGRLTYRFSQIVFAILIPVFVGAVAAVYLSSSGEEIQQSDNKKNQRTQVSSQAQFLSEMILEELDSLRANAVSYAYSLARSPLTFQIPAQSRIQHFAELETPDGKPVQVRSVARSSLWNGNSSIEMAYVLALKTFLEATPSVKQQVLKEGVSLIRLRKEANSEEEWMSFVFASPLSTDKVLVALIDPAQFFLVFQRWAAHSNNENNRSYLVGGDGQILAHSQPSWVHSRISQLPLFSNQLRGVLDGRSYGGAGEFMGIDQSPVFSAFFSVGKLPLVVVAEEVQFHQGLAQMFSTKSLGSAALLFILVLGVIFTSASYLNRKLVKVITLTVHPEKTVDFKVEDSKARRLNSKRFFKGDDLLLIDSDESDSREH